MATINQYSEVFNRLCHIVALTKDGKIEKAIDNLVITLFGLDDSFSPETPQEIGEGLSIYFNLSLVINTFAKSGL